MYKLPSHIESDNIFLIQFSDIEGRHEPLFYSPIFKINSDRKFEKLKRFTSKIIHPPEYKRDFSTNGIQLLRSQNVRPTGLSPHENPVFFSYEFLSNQKIIFPKKGQLLVVRSGVNAGDSCIIEENFTNKIIGADTLLCIPNERVIPKFLQVYFWTSFGAKQMSRHITGATNKHLNSDNLGKVKVPVLSIPEQRLCIKLFEDAYHLKLKLEAEAKKHLESIDKLLLDKLKIQIQGFKNNLQNRIFFSSANEITGNRFDPKLYSAETKAIKNAILNGSYDTVHLSDYIIQSYAGDWGKEDSGLPIENHTKCLVIRATEFDNIFNLKLENSRVKYRYINSDKLKKIDLQSGDLLIEKSGGSIDQPVGRISILRDDIIADNTLCYSNFIHKIRVDSKEFNAEYLFAYLKTIHSIGLTEAMQSQTNGIRNLIMRTYFKQQVPKPDITIQNEIANEIMSIRLRAKNKLAEAENILESAKLEIEKQLLA